MHKKDLLSQLENAKNNYILVLAACGLFSNEKSFSILEDSNCNFGGYSLEFKEVANLMRNENDRNIACKEFVNMGLRVLIKESFEIIKDYCKSSSQDGLFKQQSWYHFARIIRNCLSHNFKFKFNDHDKAKLPVRWKNREIILAMDNKHLELSFFGYVEAWELFDTMYHFVKNELV